MGKEVTADEYTVVFYGIDSTVVKTESVTAGGSATAPTIADECEIGWDKPFEQVNQDIAVYAYRLPKFSFPVYEWVEQHPGEGRISEASKDGYTIHTTYYEGAISDDSVRIDGVFYNYRALLYSGYQYITAPEMFNNLTFVFNYESHAANMVNNAVFSSGEVVQDGKYVRWKGYTDSLRWDLPDASYGFYDYRIECGALTSYTVIFYDIDGDEIKRDTVAAGGNATAPTDEQMMQTGYTFTGWDTSFTNLSGDNPIIAVHPLYEEVEGYVTVLFVDAQGNELLKSRVAMGGTVTPPTPPTIPLMLFSEWDHALDNITEPVTIRPIYVLDTNNPNILTMEQWRNTTMVEGQYYAVKGVAVIGVIGDSLEAGGTLSFRLHENADNTDWGAVLNVYRSADVLGKPFLHPAQISMGDTIIAYGQWGDRGDNNWGLIDGYLLYQSPSTARDNTVYMLMGDAQSVYDYEGSGRKQIVYINKEEFEVPQPDYSIRYDAHITIGRSDIAIAGPLSKDTMMYRTLTNLRQYGSETSFNFQEDIGRKIAYIEDVNGDGKPDITAYADEDGLSGGTQLWLSQGDTYVLRDTAFAPTNMDINGDGRMDYIYLSSSYNGTAYGYIGYGLEDGTVRMETMTIASNGSSFAPSVRRAGSIAQQLSAPTMAIDLNGNGRKELIDARNGRVFVQGDDGQWEVLEFGASITPVDLNGDGYMDFVVVGSTLSTAIYDPTQQDYIKTVIQPTGMADDKVYCHDFDGDGDIDILATFSSFYNSSYSYTVLFTNNGNGSFTKLYEQTYDDTNELWFSACQDLDGDGLYDLLALQGHITIRSYSIPLSKTFCWGEYTGIQPQVVWLKGNANGSFAAPQVLYDLEGENIYAFTLPDGAPSSYRRGSMKVHLHAEDLEGNGTMRVWASGCINNMSIVTTNRTVDYTVVYPIDPIGPNARPTAPAAPTAQYQDGMLTVSWGHGADDKTAPADLTYALRIGSTPGGNDILAAHANADGSRRNVLDGNMGHSHSYSIDLRTYAPATLYVAVQAIDAQHQGSLWSEETTVIHSFIPVEISLSNDHILFGDTAEVHYTALSEGYTHTWLFGDGEIVSDSLFLRLAFPTGGEKTITHIVTGPDGKKDTASVVLTILPARTGEKRDVSENQYLLQNILSLPLADYNYDGRQDGLLNMIYEGDSAALFKKAGGLWNSSTLSYDTEKVRWYDRNRDGHPDLLFGNKEGFYAMMHEPNRAAFAAPAEDNTLLYLLGYGYSQSTSYTYFSLPDMRHTGVPEIMEYSVSGSNIPLGARALDVVSMDEVNTLPLTVHGDMTQFYLLMASSEGRIMVDMDHDGFIDIVGIGMMNIEGWSSDSLIVFYNRGNGVYEQGNIPFSETLPADGSYYMEDLNGDGYYELILRHSNYWNYNTDMNYIYVFWNNGNESFSRELLPSSTNKEEYPIAISDIDHNGYPDITALLYRAETEDKGVYTWFMGPTGVQYSGYILEGVSGYDLQDLYLASDDHRLRIEEGLYPIVTQVDNRPAPPTAIQALMTDQGLLITWADALDDHTPASLMRYNLSVKQQGASTYLISPQNGGNDQAAYLPGYTYIHATQYLIPTSALSNGNYEIRLQSVDKQNKMSLFSETMVVTVARNPIEAPSTACTYDYTTISYQGEAVSDSPVWDFGEDAVSMGEGYGPYTVYWTTGGQKIISLSLGDTTYTDTVSVPDTYAYPVTLPQELYEDTPFTISVADGVTYEWYARFGENEDWHKVDATGILMDATTFLIYDRRLKVDGNTITAYALDGEESLCSETLYLQFVFHTPEGCTGYYNWQVTVRPNASIPTLTLVTTDADGHNVISWTNTEAFQYIYVYKEGSTLDAFEQIGYTAAANGSFTDILSDATQKAERYRITGMSEAGESPASTIHQTVHLTISRGVQDGTFNLIWNKYSGANVVSYNILRGASPASLSLIATVAASNTSYTDQAPEDEQPYYAIQYVLAAAANAPGRVDRAPSAALVGQSNVVNRKDLDHEDIEEVRRTDVRCTKVLRDGHIYLMYEGRMYDVRGAVVE